MHNNMLWNKLSNTEFVYVCCWKITLKWCSSQSKLIKLLQTMFLAILKLLQMHFFSQTFRRIILPQQCFVFPYTSLDTSSIVGPTFVPLIVLLINIRNFSSSLTLPVLWERYLRNRMKYFWFFLLQYQSS